MKSMKSTGIVRKIDELGRVVIPVELRKSLDIEEGTSIEIFTDGKKIVLEKYEFTTGECKKCHKKVDILREYYCKYCGEKL